MNKQEVLCKVRDLKKAINWLKISEYVSNNDAIDYVANIYETDTELFKVIKETSENSCGNIECGQTIREFLHFIDDNTKIEKK